MDYLKNLENLTTEILSDKINYQALKEVLEDYKELLLKLSELDVNKETNKEDIHFKNGIALGTTWAAFCITDLIRTRQFMRGIFAAVKHLHHKKTKPVRILYAGTGPFATLVLPLITKYSPEDLQLILLEVNPQTIVHLKQLIKSLGIENYIEKIICEDATKYKIDKETTIDILISETMQHALVKEQQVPIMLNLVNQLNKEAIIIPNKIQLDLALMNTGTKLISSNNIETEKYKILTTLLEFDKNFINSYFNTIKTVEKTNKIELGKQIHFRKYIKNVYDKLVVLTSIQVYKDECIKIDSSSLTIPKILFNLNTIAIEKQEISIVYSMDGNPKFEYELN